MVRLGYKGNSHINQKEKWIKISNYTVYDGNNL